MVQENEKRPEFTKNKDFTVKDLTKISKIIDDLATSGDSDVNIRETIASLREKAEQVTFFANELNEQVKSFESLVKGNDEGLMIKNYTKDWVPVEKLDRSLNIHNRKGGTSGPERDKNISMGLRMGFVIDHAKIDLLNAIYDTANIVGSLGKGIDETKQNITEIDNKIGKEYDRQNGGEKR